MNETFLGRDLVVVTGHVSVRPNVACFRDAVWIMSSRLSTACGTDWTRMTVH